MKTAVAVFLCALLLPGPCNGIRRKALGKVSAHDSSLEMAPADDPLDRAFELTQSQVVAMQWSPHWRCFAMHKDNCGEHVVELLPQFVAKYEVDFLNVGMMAEEFSNTAKTSMPAMHSITKTCPPPPAQGGDRVELFYNSSTWELNASTTIEDCLDQKKMGNEDVEDRAYVAGVFNRRVPGSKVDKVLVIGAHFPHPVGGSSSDPNAIFSNKSPAWEKLGTSVQKTLEENEDAEVLLIGDFNYDMAPLNTDKHPYRQSKSLVNEATYNLGKYTPKGLSGMIGQEFKKLVEQPTKSSNDLWELMTANMAEDSTKPSLKKSTEPKPTCCADQRLLTEDMVEQYSDEDNKIVGATKNDAAKAKLDGYVSTGEEPGEVFTPYCFDRVLSSFGDKLETILPLGRDTSVTHVPTRVATVEEINVDLAKLLVGAFHKPIIATITN